MMNKFLTLTFSLFLLILAPSASAGLILEDDLVKDTHYIEFGGYKWAWASSVNVQFWQFTNCYNFDDSFNFDDYLTTELSDFSSCYNQLYAPQKVSGWGYVEDYFATELLNQSLNDLMLSLYNRGLDPLEQKDTVQSLFNNGSINAVEYWNTGIGTVARQDDHIFASKWDQTNTVDSRSFIGWLGGGDFFNDTIYIKALETEKVPEPSALFLFALALVLFQLKRKW